MMQHVGLIWNRKITGNEMADVITDRAAQAMALHEAHRGRIMYKRFCCDRQSNEHSVGVLSTRTLAELLGQAPLKTAEPVPWSPRAVLATRLSHLATNHQE